MTSISPKGAVASYPRSLSSIAVTVGGLAMFLILASLLLVSSPIGTTVHEYFVGVDSSTKLDAARMQDNQKLFEVPRENVDVVGKNDKSGSDFGAPLNSTNVDSVDNTNPLPIETNPRVVSSDSELEVGAVNNNSSVASKSVENGEVEISHNEDNGKDENSSDKGKGDESSLSSDFVENGEIENSRIEDNGKVENSIEKDKGDESNLSSSSDLKSKSDQDMSNMVSDAIKSGADDSDCYLYHGSWFYDPLGPSYTNNTCPVLTQMQNCQGNGRPDKDYENWRWKPSKCDLPRFDARKFLELMRGKTIAFIGDSVARNQMESMLCLLWQVEVPKNRGNKRMQRYYFRSTSTMVVRIWSSWLVHKTTEPIGFAPEGITKLHLDAPDEDFMNYIQDFNVVVLSSGHWFAKQSVYVLNNEIVGGQLWWPDKSVKMKVNNVEAFGISVETALTAIGTNPNFTGLAIVRTYSPDHYEGGAWNTGGSCTGKIKPLEPGHLVENGFTDIMHKKQVTGFERAIKKKNDKAKLKLMDITEAFSYRHDGHPGPYRNPDPNKITKRGPDGKPPPQDCLHWCMPGAVDTWNELVLEIIRREYEGSQNIT